MSTDHPPEYRSGDLRICPERGEITDGSGIVRLAPVNMKVLSALLARAGKVVSRAELYEDVWKNQVVGEDALNRCISDIRAELRKLSVADAVIETLPKRGYRWTADVAWTDDHAPKPLSGRVSRAFPDRLLRLAARGAGYLLAMAVMASTVVWMIDRFAGSGSPVVALLPVAAAPEHKALAAELDLALSAYLLALDEVELLSPSAIESRPLNPFPFFYYEFGAHWLVESDLRDAAGELLLTIHVVDSRTGIVEMQQSGSVFDDDRGIESTFPPLGEFILSRMAR